MKLLPHTRCMICDALLINYVSRLPSAINVKNTTSYQLDMYSSLTRGRGCGLIKCPGRSEMGFMGISGGSVYLIKSKL